MLCLIVLTGGFLMTPAPTATAEDKKEVRVFEMRIYTAPEGKLPALLSRFRDHTVKLFEKHGMTNIGYWTDKKDGKDRLIYILAYPSKEAADASWKAFRVDPVWVKAKADSEVNGTLVEKLESIWMSPTDFSTIK